MSSNRISRFVASDFASTATFAQVPAVQSQVVATFGVTNQSTMVMVPSVSLASWQAQVYRLAYQKALVDTAPPRHFARFFSVWN
jgi:hypothetical protein